MLRPTAAFAAEPHPNEVHGFAIYAFVRSAVNARNKKWIKYAQTSGCVEHAEYIILSLQAPSLCARVAVVVVEGSSCARKRSERFCLEAQKKPIGLRSCCVAPL